jgi:hypothetical protein
MLILRQARLMRDINRSARYKHRPLGGLLTMIVVSVPTGGYSLRDRLIRAIGTPLPSVYLRIFCALCYLYSVTVYVAATPAHSPLGGLMQAPDRHHQRN